MGVGGACPLFSLKEVAMWKQIVQLLGVMMMTVAATGPARAEDVPFHEFLMGDVNVRVISLVPQNLNASILRAVTEEQKAAIARAYPDGAVRNVLNVLLVRGNGVTALVDTGYDWSVGALDTALAQANLSREDVTHVVITHAHGDHVGGLVQNGTATFPRADVLFSEKEFMVSLYIFGGIPSLRSTGFPVPQKAVFFVQGRRSAALMHTPKDQATK